MKRHKGIALMAGLLLAGATMLAGASTVKAEQKTDKQYEEKFQQYIEDADADDDPEYDKYMGASEENGQDALYTVYKGALTAGNYKHNSRYNGYIVKNGIDVSKYQGYMDWNGLKNSGVEFAIIRVGYRGYTSGNIVEDETYRVNFEHAREAGVPVGAYVFSQAITEAEAVEEANFLLARIKDYDIKLPVVIDYEYASGNKGRLYDAGLSAEAATAVCRKFCETIEAAGYTPMVYANKNMLTSSLHASELDSKYDIWLANYTTETSYSGDYTFWQYSSRGQITGLPENTTVDCNFWYVPSVRSNGLDLAKNGKWYYYVDGTVNKEYTGLKQNDSGWWYVRNGEVDFNYTGLAQNEYGWWYVKNGAVDFGYTGLAQNEVGWWCVVNGGVDFGYTGLAQNEYGWWYVANGGVDFGYTGLAQNENGWWYVANGSLNWDYSGVVPYNDNWWYVQNGMLDWSYTGLAQNENGWWYIANGKLDWNYTNLVPYDGNWWYVVNGGVIGDYTGLVLYDDNWWYIANGMLDWSYTGLVQNESGLWYVQDGMVRFDYTGEVNYNGALYNVVGGQAIQT